MPALWLRALPDAHTNATYYGQDVAADAGAGTYEEAHHELFKVSPEVGVVHLAYTLLSVFTVIFGMFSAFIKEKLYAGEAIIATCVGIGFGPYGANIFSPTEWGGGGHADGITLEVTRVVIALSVFAIGVELPRAYVLRHWKSLVFLLGPVMLVGWMVSGAFIYALIPKLNFLDSLVIAACVTPTDPILAASVVGKGKFAQEHVPAHIRHVLQCESGCNDGAAFPFLYFAIFWSIRGEESIGHAVGWWVALILLYQIVLGIIIGSVVGIVARKGMKYAKYHDLIDRESMVAMYVALALLVTGLTTLAGSDDLLAAFACGTAFAWDDWFSESIEDSNFSSILDLIFNCAVFFYIGATIPFAAWSDPNTTVTPWRLVVLGICILLLRRMPTIFTLQKIFPDCRTKREAIFMGHFGPMGVGALFIATLARERLPTPTYPPEGHLDVLSLVIEPVVYFLILCSVLVHGLSIPVFTSSRRLQRRVQSFHRTFTAQESHAGAEPSWLTKVRRAGDAEKHDSREESPDESPSTGSSTAANAEDDVVGSHDKGVAMEDGHPERVTRWKEGRETIVEDAEGEIVNVDDKRGAAAAPKEIDVEAQAPPKHVRNQKEADQRMKEAEQSRHDADPEEDHWWVRDPKTNAPREMSGEERRQAKRDRAVRRERHFCRGNEPVRWREGNRVILENPDGETKVIQEAGPEDERDAPHIAGEFPHVHRVTGREHNKLSKLTDIMGVSGHKGKESLDKAFHRIEHGQKKEHPADSNMPERPRPVFRRSTALHSFLGAGKSSQAGRSSAANAPSVGAETSQEPSATSSREALGSLPAGHAQPQARSEPETSPHESQGQAQAGPSSKPQQNKGESSSRPERSRPSSQASNDNDNDRNIRFNLPRDDEVQRYDLE